MLSINKIMITGRLTRDPETRYTPSGNAVCNFSIAVNRNYRDPRTNDWKEETFFLDVEAWGKIAERCAETLKKGRPVYIEGRLRADTWEREGQKQTRIRAVAERVTAFDVPSRVEDASEDIGPDFEAGFSSNTSTTNSAPKVSSPGTPQHPPSASSKSAADGLAYDSPAGEGGHPVDDDVPF